MIFSHRQIYLLGAGHHPSDGLALLEEAICLLSFTRPSKNVLRNTSNDLLHSGASSILMPFPATSSKMLSNPESVGDDVMSKLSHFCGSIGTQTYHCDMRQSSVEWISKAGLSFASFTLPVLG